MSGIQSKTLILALILFMLLGMVFTNQVLAQTVNLGGFDIIYGGSSYNSGTNQTTFNYTVASTKAAKQALNHFTVGINPAWVVIGSSPSNSVSIGYDSDTGI